MDNHIPYVHNYCDRWCERCTLTSRCRVFEQTSQMTPEQQDVGNRAFWEYLSSMFTNAMEMVQKKAEELGIDLTVTDEEAEQYLKEQKDADTRIRKSRLFGLCKEYDGKVASFMKDHALEQTVSVLDERKTQTIADCFEVITWYQHFIAAKLHRAMHGLMTDDLGDEYADMPKDYDGSAKIALIAVDRSIAAWTTVYELLPSREDACLSALIVLQQIKNRTEKQFPEAYRFVRPGFDE